MSLIIVVYVNEGIVLASDRRTTYNTTTENNGIITHTVGVHTTNSTDKTFLCPNGSGISTCGDATLSGKPITEFIKTFIREQITSETKVSQIPKLMVDYFSSFEIIPNAQFIIAGYEDDGNSKKQKIFRLRLIDKNIELIDSQFQGAAWNGEEVTLTRLLSPVKVRNNNSGEYFDLPPQEVLWGFFTLQDAVDFAKYAVDVTIKTMRFINVVETVGGDIDILVITPDESKWLQKKEID